MKIFSVHHHKELPARVRVLMFRSSKKTPIPSSFSSLVAFRMVSVFRANLFIDFVYSSRQPPSGIFVKDSGCHQTH